MEAVESKSQSQGQDSQIISENSIRLAENIEESKTPVTCKVTFTTGGGFEISGRECLESSFKSSVDSSSESFISIDKDLISPVNDDASKVKETKVHDPEVLLKRILTLEEEHISLNKRIQNLSDENALLEAEKANVSKLKLLISVKNRRIDIMEKVLEGSRKQVSTAEDEISKLKQELSIKDLDQKRQLLSHEQNINSLQEQLDLKQVRYLKFCDDLTRFEADIAKRDDEITELNFQINLLKSSYAAEEDSWDAEIERLETELREKCELVDDLNQKHDDLMSYRDEWKLKVAALEREVVRQKEVTSLRVAEIAKRDEQITELNTQINLLKNSHATEEDKRNTDIGRLRMEIREKCELIDDLNQKQGDLMSDTDEVTSLGQAEITKRDEHITELNTQINLLKNSHATEEDKWNTDIGRLKTEIREKCVLADDLNQKLDALMSFTYELKLNRVELEREVYRQKEVTSLRVAEIAKRDEQITELNTQINLLKNSHATEEDKWNTDIGRLKTEIREKCVLADDLNQKLDALMSFTYELKLNRVELEREVYRQKEVTSLGLAEIAKRDEQIAELNTQINQVKNSHAVEEDRWKTDIGMLKREIREKCELVDDLNRKHDDLMSFTDELKLKVVELEKEVEVMSEEKREAIRQLSFTVEHYMSAYKQLRQVLVAIKRLIDFKNSHRIPSTEYRD